MVFKNSLETTKNPFSDAAKLDASQVIQMEGVPMTDLDIYVGDEIEKREELATKREKEEEDKKKKTISTKQKELNQIAIKERDILTRKRAAEVAVREATLGPRPKNMPSCYPLVKHYPKDDIPEHLLKPIGRLYSCYLALYLVLPLNIFGIIYMAISEGYDGTGPRGQEIGLSIGYFLLLPPLSFFLWYMPAYRATMNSKSMLYFIFFIINAIHMVILGFMSLGIRGT
jgi:hypothetical protein